MRKVCNLVLLLFILVFSFSCQKESDQVARINKEDFTVAEQQQIGQFLKEEIEDNYGLYPRLNADIFTEPYNYLNTLMETLLVSANVKRRSDLNWNITIIRNDEERNAFILPGGELYLYTGLLKYLNSENELLSIIAHEITYADTDDAINRLKAEYGGVLLGDILLGNEISSINDILTNLPRLVLPEDEVMEADVFSVNLLCDYAWDARGLKSIFERVDSLNANLTWLQTRQGDLKERINNVEVAALPCGLEGQTFDERYLKFKTEWLP